jgi:hypothetical protein
VGYGKAMEFLKTFYTEKTSLVGAWLPHFSRLSLFLCSLLAESSSKLNELRISVGKKSALIQVHVL